VIPERQPGAQGDKVLWLLGAGVAIVAVAFFVLLNMGTPEFTATRVEITPEKTQAAAVRANPEDGDAPFDLSVRLNRARLALDAGMLTEPEGYSAWSIYAAILDQDAENTDAGAGLRLVADRVVDQAFDALNAGRRDMAEALAERVLDRFPDDRGATEIITRVRHAIVAERPAPESAPEIRTTAPEQNPRAQQRSEERARAAQTEVRDPIAAIYSNFTRALAGGALTLPVEDNAVGYLDAMRRQSADHAMTHEAELQLFDAMFARHNEAFNRLDTDAAQEWLVAADELNVDADRVAAAHDQILDFLAAQAAVESITAAELSIRNYVPPEYPNLALRRGLEGWVDIAFVLSREGRPMSVEVTEASNSIFRNAATSAVREWEFEPYTIHERVVEQHAHTRIRFVLED
jgi:TonB family protein